MSPPVAASRLSIELSRHPVCIGVAVTKAQIVKRNVGARRIGQSLLDCRDFHGIALNNGFEKDVMRNSSSMMRTPMVRPPSQRLVSLDG